MSKIAIISDIHGNPTALQKVLKDAEERKCERIVCLGDIVGYGYDPNACIDIVRYRNIECLLGNHDAGLISRLDLDWFNSFAANAIRRQRPLVPEENKKWMAGLHYNLVEGLQTATCHAFAHGFLVGKSRIILPASAYFEYVNGLSDAVWQFRVMQQQGVKTLFVGHTHYANAYLSNQGDSIRDEYIDLEDEQSLDLSKWQNAIVNVGSVGYPRNQPYSIYGIYDTEAQEFMHRILPFDFDDYISNMEKCGATVPPWIESRKREAKERTIGYC